ncbi:hypothetical protein [Pseudomonas sp. DWP3-1-2]|uniref:hypothetical protein n=1 Tax=Pseudomonas sp. DWP3-1-2 TaxID=2804645 RepID=UPI003CEDA434
MFEVAVAALTFTDVKTPTDSNDSTMTLNDVFPVMTALHVNKVPDSAQAVVNGLNLIGRHSIESILEHTLLTAAFPDNSAANLANHDPDQLNDTSY